MLCFVEQLGISCILEWLVNIISARLSVRYGNQGAERHSDDEAIFLPFARLHTNVIPECHSLPFEHPHLMGVSRDEGRFTQELLLRDGPEVSAGEVVW